MNKLAALLSLCVGQSGLELPDVAEAQRLPDLPTIRMAIEANELYLSWAMRTPLTLEQRERAVSEALDLQHLWSLMQVARDDSDEKTPGRGCWNRWERREALAEIRDTIGMRRWVLGDWGYSFPGRLR